MAIVTGAQGGVFSSSPAGLVIDSITGMITPATSIPGVYTVTYKITASDDCGLVNINETTTVTITDMPVASFMYAGTPYCSNEANPFPTFIAAGMAGTFTSTPGLVFVDIHTGEIDLISSTPGNYIVTNTIPASGGCPEVVAKATVEITKLPVADFTYVGNPFCSDGINPVPTFINGGIAGTFSSIPAGLVFKSNNGEVDLSASIPGTYTVTNLIASACCFYGICYHVGAWNA
jgi:hypothetical protein